MKILHFYKTALPTSYGGVQTFIDSLCRHTASLGCDNKVLSLSPHPHKSPIQMQDGYKVYEVQENFHLASTSFSYAAYGAYKKLGEEADLIHLHFPNPFADILHFITALNKPTLLTYHSDIVKQKMLSICYQPLQHAFLKNMHHIVATSPNYLASSKTLQKYSEKTSIIPIGIDMDIAAHKPKLCERFSYWQEKLQKPFFLFSGALRYYKGIDIALKAVANTNIRLVIMGGGGIEAELKERAAALNLENVDFLGYVSEEDKAILLDLCYGFVFPSNQRSEAFGISLLEAAAYAKPLISCEIGTGTTYINLHNETGHVIAPNDHTQLREAMQYLLNHPEEAQQMGLKAQQRARDLFTAEQQATSYVNLYKKLGAELNSSST